MNVLSLFDGMSCGQIALNRAGIKYDKYFASEIDKYAIQTTKKNYPNTIHLGDVRNVIISDLPKIDLLIGGSPCQSFSFAGKRKGMSTKDNIEIFTLEHYIELKKQNFEFEGQSYLFWEYMRLLNELKPKYFLLENVLMGEKWERVLSKAIGINPIEINSALVSAQNRRRLYWTNIGTVAGGLFGFPESIIKQPKDKGILLKDILEDEVDEKYFLSDKMINTFNKRAANLNNEKVNIKDIEDKASIFTASIASIDISDNFIVCHNMMPRSSKTGKGGTGLLSRSDGKTYCLDTGTTNAIEIFSNKRLNKTIEKHKNELEHNTLIDSYNQSIHKDKSITITTSVNAGNNTHIYQEFVLGGDYCTDNGFRWRKSGKSGTLMARAREDESCGQLAFINRRIRKLTPIECERLQTIEDNYTAGVSNSQRYKMIGNGWTVDVIAHIFSYLERF